MKTQKEKTGSSFGSVVRRILYWKGRPDLPLMTEEVSEILSNSEKGWELAESARSDSSRTHRDRAQDPDQLELSL